MRICILFILISFFFISCGNKLSVSGTWQNNKNELQLTPDNKFILTDSNATKFTGVYAVVFDKMQFINSGNDLAMQCMRPGRYSFTLFNDSLQLTMQDDPCTERKFMLNGIHWSRKH